MQESDAFWLFLTGEHCQRRPCQLRLERACDARQRQAQASSAATGGVPMR